MIHYFHNAANITFVVNTAAATVPLSLAVGAEDFTTTGGFSFFTYGDNIFLESVIFQIPYQFGQGTLSPLSFGLGAIDKNVNMAVIPEVGGQIILPDVAQEYSLNTFIKMPFVFNSDWKIQVYTVAGTVNMFNAPASLNGTTQQAKIFLKIRHTLDLVV